MDRNEFTTEQLQALATIAEKDQWEPEELERRVRHHMREGRTFPNAVMYSLAQADRPPDNPKDDPRKAALMAKVEEMKRLAMERFK